MTTEFKQGFLSDINHVCILRTRLVESDTETLYLSYAHFGQMMCVELIQICEKHQALFAIETTPSPLIKVAIFQRQSNQVKK